MNEVYYVQYSLLLFQTEVSEFLWEAAEKSGSKTQSLCGVPYTALPLATVSQQEYNSNILPLCVHLFWSCHQASLDRKKKKKYNIQF